MDRETNQRVYKGEGTLNFICYYPYAFGFNKYVVRAADYYKCTQPEHIILEDSIRENPYRKEKRPRMLPYPIKEHYNVQPNMNTPWKGGYPSIEQVQWGELYFKDSETGENKMLIDVRNYWEGIPEWEGTAKLLVSPTLDYDQELIFMPQYSSTNYMNLDTGLNRQNGLIGSRILVYNPGDLPVDFELRLGNLSSKFRKNLDKYTFRVSRYNVQRLTIEQAVDWTGLKTQNVDDNKNYKYGNRYFTILEPPTEENSVVPNYRHLKFGHPKHTYLVEPIPREKLGDFIRLFYWQSSLLNDGFSEYVCDFEEGKMYADRYEELYKLCITDDERYELYWKTLKEAILDRYQDANSYIIENEELDNNYKFFNKDYRYQDFVYDYFYNPPEYIRNRDDLKYGQFLFNIGRIPSYYTYDYFDINNENFDTIDGCCCGCDDCICNQEANRTTIKPLYLDTEKRMLYNVNDPKWISKNITSKEDIAQWKEDNPNLVDNFFKFKPTKQSFNDNIEHGHWFKLPPGWSLIDISPVVEEDIWGGKRWLDARPFDWGATDEAFRAEYNKIYKAAGAYYIGQKAPRNSNVLFNTGYQKRANENNSGTTFNPIANLSKKSTAAEIQDYFTKNVVPSNNEIPHAMEDYLQFRRWYPSSGFDYDSLNDNYLNNFKDSILGLGYEIHQSRIEHAEIGFLKTLADYWRVNHLDANGQPEGDVDDWWWYANNYIWDNFPPIYWGYADLLNKLQIKYVPLFY